ncbi:MAG TPA: SUF system NifU family Fe-S cluster assembly protein [Bryobacteraceae bacterium]|jgi:nitrogen fixation NifU-like protein
MYDLGDLYQELILDHSKRPRNFAPLEGANASAEGYNPLCGDKVTVQLKLENNVIRDASFHGSGCAISTASASLMTEALKGRTRAEAEVLFERFHELLTGKLEAPPELGKLAVFSGVREYPMRVKCATLAWHTLHAALQSSGMETPHVSTE